MPPALRCFQGSDSIKDYRREQWEYYRCAEAFEMAVHAPVAEVCQELIFSISAIGHDGALGEFPFLGTFRIV